MIKKAIKVKGIRKITKAFGRRFSSEWSTLGYTFSYLLEEDHLSKMYVYMEGDRVVDYIYYTEIKGQPVVSPYFCDNRKKKEEINDIKAFWGSIIVEADYFDYETCGMMQCSLKCSFNEQMEYNTPGSEAYYTNKAELVDFFVRLYEDIYFPEIKDLSEITFGWFSSKEVYEGGLITGDPLSPKQISTWKDSYSGNSGLITGFHYFKLDNIFEYGEDCAHYLLAYHKEKNVILGVIKVGRYGNSEREKRQTINYIDVSMAYRRRGVAKAMIEKLDQFLDKSLPLVLTDESDLGKTCRMAEHFKNTKFSCEVYTREEWYSKF